MRLTRRIFWGAVALAVGAPAVGALLRGVTALPLGLLALGALWSVVAERTRLAGAAFALCVGGIALGIWLGVGIGWLLVGMTAALAAWDLEAFNAWLVSIARVENERELVREHRLIYIYHDRIDMTGDKQASETKTFEAAAQTVQELSQLVGFIINSLNGSTVLVTADHGFMYQESALDESDKSTLDDKPPGTLKAKKRYLIGRNLGATSKAWSGNTKATAGTTDEGSLDFWVPKGASRFHFTGGARFVHGSAMPQEIVVPVITVRESETEQAKTRPVNISLLGNADKVVTNTQRFEFIQTDAVSERVLARSVVVSLRDGDTLISDEQSVTFDSASQLLDERKRSLFLTVRAGSHDSSKRYDLVVRDAVTKVEVLRQPIKIDLAFGNDF